MKDMKGVHIRVYYQNIIQQEHVHTTRNYLIRLESGYERKLVMHKNSESRWPDVDTEIGPPLLLSEP